MWIINLFCITPFLLKPVTATYVLPSWALVVKLIIPFTRIFNFRAYKTPDNSGLKCMYLFNIIVSSFDKDNSLFSRSDKSII